MRTRPRIKTGVKTLQVEKETAEFGRMIGERRRSLSSQALRKSAFTPTRLTADLQSVFSLTK